MRPGDQTADADPPQYTEATRLHFRIPSYEEVMSLYEFEDSLRLPTYQSRQLGRYHPYWRFRPTPSPQLDETRYYNTIFDDEYEPLDIPPFVPPTALIPAAAAAIDVAPLVAAVEANDANIDIGAAVVNPPTNEREARDGDFNLQDERRQRIYRLRVVIVDFLLAVRRAVDTRHLNDPAPAPPTADPAIAELAEAVEPIEPNPDTSDERIQRSTK